ncbi:hypothetical protein [Rhizobacter sp. Root1221]|uniref:hypothetical protein n=1 Tax=Rhizobacter sp. Root1221 TaxID=1736433 RepID=UPI000700F5A9|nr:hypothetical protein [Rhizobacter sp. Root1221]KQV78906.1 hypothetical protein ASC87_11275 [Rhizobacter sp. Root1221]
MFNATSLTLVKALVGATAYAQPAPSAAVEPIPVQAVAHIHRARVDIYCGHNTEAVAGIRAASEQLRTSSAVVPAETFAALEQAAWLTRHDQYLQAEEALETALARMTPASARA